MFKFLKNAQPSKVSVEDKRTFKPHFMLGLWSAATIFGGFLTYQTFGVKKEIGVDFKSLTQQIAIDFERVYQPTGLLKSPVVINLINAGDDTACGKENTGGGLFYCPSNNQIYIVQSSQDMICIRFKGCLFGVSREVAYVYVLAHELAHHIQNANGMFDKMHAAWMRQDGSHNIESVKAELQADCLAGFYMGQSFKTHKLEQKIKTASLHLAQAIGDDILSNSTAKPIDYTHGTGVQRQEWFSEGYSAKDVKAACL